MESVSLRLGGNGRGAAQASLRDDRGKLFPSARGGLLTTISATASPDRLPHRGRPAKANPALTASARSIMDAELLLTLLPGD